MSKIFSCSRSVVNSISDFVPRSKINSVAVLANNVFSRLTYDEKITVKNLKRPMPQLCLENKQSVKGKDVIRKFKLDIYLKNNWICGCEIKKALFCFPCVLFGGEP